MPHKHLIFSYLFINCRESRYFEDIAKFNFPLEDDLQLFPGLGTTGVCKTVNWTYFFISNENLTLLDLYFQRFHCQKKFICNSAVFSPTAQLQISFVEIILRLPVDISTGFESIYFLHSFQAPPPHVFVGIVNV